MPGERPRLRSQRLPIFYLASAWHTDSIGRFAASPGGRHLADRLVTVLYEHILSTMTATFWWQRTKAAWWEIADAPWSLGSADTRHGWRQVFGRGCRALRAPRTRPSGVYIFSDIEVLSSEAAGRAASLWSELAESGAAVRILNHPTRSMRRYELLRTLHELGINRFNVYRATEARWPTRYPVFVRFENDHGGSRSPLLRDREELEAAVDVMARSPARREEILITEFCDTVDAHGVYRKYGAFVVGERIFPKNVQFGRHWVLKRSQIADDELLREEREYVDTNPHADQLRRIFRLARIDYGRVDYGLLDGRLQVWEINTNPHITNLGPNRYGPRRDVYEAVERDMASALEELLREPAACPRRSPPSRARMIGRLGAARLAGCPGPDTEQSPSSHGVAKGRP